MKKAEQEHIKSVGAERFGECEAAAYLVAKLDGRLRAAEKIRAALAFAAALKGTGYDVSGFICAKDPPAEFQAICDDVFAHAVNAATKKFQGEAA